MPAENKPCPFCGCSIIDEIDCYSSGDDHLIECTQCGGRLNGDTLLQARSKWNRRSNAMVKKFTTDNQQRQQEIVAVCSYIEQTREDEVDPVNILNHVYGTLRQLLA